jgi:hypothetical protein
LFAGGVGLALVGGCTALLGWMGAINQMRRGDDPSPILDLVQLVGLLSILCGAVLVAVSIGWWLFRIGRAIAR